MSSRVRQSSSDIIMVAIGLSLIFHLGLGGGMSLVSRFMPSSNPDETAVSPIEWMELKDPKSSKTQTFLPNVEVPKSLRIEDQSKKATFMSKETVRVKEESKAQFIPGSESFNSPSEATQPNSNTRLIQPSAGSVQKKISTASKDKSRAEKVITGPKINNLKLFENSTAEDVEINTSESETSQLSGNGGSTPISFPPPSQLAVDLPSEIKVGSMTVLNSDSSIYFSYFDRMQKLVYYRWVRNVDETMSWLLLKNRLPATSMVYSTIDEIVLDSSGNFLRAHNLVSSGIPEVDDTVEKAFSQARIIPNPPEGLIKQGLVRFKVKFDIYYHPSYGSYRR